MKKIIYILLLLINSFYGIAQKRETDSLPKNYEDYVFLKPGDTLVIQLNEFSIYPKQKFSSSEDVRYYLWLRSKVFRVYPYAKLASQRLDTLNNRLKRIDSKSKRKSYTKLIQNYVEGEFTDQLKKMTKTEGRILIKLIHRQTGKTAFENIKVLRSGWNAFWHNTKANFFKLSLKDEYQPEFVNEDFLIEEILQRAFQNGFLELQNTKLNFDFSKVIFEKKSKINVEEYKIMFAKMKKKK